MSTFVHNEPTSLTIIQENNLPETFYNAIEAGIEPAIEVRSLGRFWPQD
jgi:E3 ubiquitin-protein ligase HUWE1